MKLIMVGGWFTIFNFFEWLTLQISGDSSLGSYYLEVGISCPSGHENGVFRLIWGFTESPPKGGGLLLWHQHLASSSEFYGSYLIRVNGPCHLLQRQKSRSLTLWPKLRMNRQRIYCFSPPPALYCALQQR